MQSYTEFSTALREDIMRCNRILAPAMHMIHREDHMDFIINMRWMNHRLNRLDLTASIRLKNSDYVEITDDAMGVLTTYAQYKNDMTSIAHMILEQISQTNQ